jgi:hypothetical protein
VGRRRGESNVAVGVVAPHQAPRRRAPAWPSTVSSAGLPRDQRLGGARDGPDLVGKARRPADNTAVRMLNGPGNNAESVRNGATHQLKAGDVMVIPAGTGHWFTKIDDHITYLMIRIDPDKVAPLKDEAASKADLRP